VQGVQLQCLPRTHVASGMGTSSLGLLKNDVMACVPLAADCSALTFADAMLSWAPF
jgi:hypothetical protein